MGLPGKSGMVAPGVTDSMGTQIYPHFNPEKKNPPNGTYLQKHPD
jgi:hypothetical protein